MRTEGIKKLIEKAQDIMGGSLDPIHDLPHVRRVVQYTQKMVAQMEISETERCALELAAWWHDAGRTITKNPSIIWMLFVDDFISAIMLWIWTIRYRVFGDVVGISMRLIICKSLGTGAILTRILLPKRHQLLLDILHDADRLDVFNVNRIIFACQLAEYSHLYGVGYKILTWYNLCTKHLHMKTKAAREYFLHILKELLEWISQPAVKLWHEDRFGKNWLDKTLLRLEVFIFEIESLNAAV